ncbi:MAG: hypothetical protein H6669_12170 [Ardenticatenaceae bacterium]|nr:hypothetical protein [Ardenticatenaceae bacterium]
MDSLTPLAFGCGIANDTIYGPILEHDPTRSDEVISAMNCIGYSANFAFRNYVADSKASSLRWMARLCAAHPAGKTQYVHLLRLLCRKKDCFGQVEVDKKAKENEIKVKAQIAAPTRLERALFWRCYVRSTEVVGADYGSGWRLSLVCQKATSPGFARDVEYPCAAAQKRKDGTPLLPYSPRTNKNAWSFGANELSVMSDDTWLYQLA